MIGVPAWLILLILAAVALIFGGLTLTAVLAIPSGTSESASKIWRMIATGALAGALVLPGILGVVAMTRSQSSVYGKLTLSGAVVRYCKQAFTGSIAGGIVGNLAFAFKRGHKSDPGGQNSN